MDIKSKLRNYVAVPVLGLASLIVGCSEETTPIATEPQKMEQKKTANYFTNFGEYTMGNSASGTTMGVSSGDFDGDGDQDIAIVTYIGNGDVRLIIIENKMEQKRWE